MTYHLDIHLTNIKPLQFEFFRLDFNQRQNLQQPKMIKVRALQEIEMSSDQFRIDNDVVRALQEIEMSSDQSRIVNDDLSFNDIEVDVHSWYRMTESDGISIIENEFMKLAFSAKG